MSLRALSMAVLALLVAAAAAAAPRESPADLDEPFTLQLAGAAPRNVFEAYASILQAELEFDPEIEGEVTIDLREVSLRTSMQAVCEMLRCTFGIDEGPPRRLVVKAGRVSLGQAEPIPGDLETPVDMSLRDAPARVVFESFARIGGWRLDLEEAKISIELDSTPLHQALDEVCARIGCDWELDETGEEGVLRIEWVD